MRFMIWAFCSRVGLSSILCPRIWAYVAASSTQTPAQSPPPPPPGLPRGAWENSGRVEYIWRPERCRVSPLQLSTPI